MKFHYASLAVAAVLGFVSTPALAADWAGVREIGGGVPVPVPPPAPIPTFDADSDWYVGLYLGGDIRQDIDILNQVTCGCTIAVDSHDIGTTPIFGFTFGRYITPSLRAEIAIDYHPDQQPFRTDSADLVPQQSLTVAAANGGTDTGTYDVHRTDIVRVARTTGLVNLLYDINTGTRFTPYLGGGVGFSWRRLSREYAEYSTCASAHNDFNGVTTNYAPPDCGPRLPNPYTTSGTDSKEQIAFAAALQAGVAIALTDEISWDNGWQMLWEDNGLVTTAPTVSGASTISYKDAVLQQFRTGLRIRFD